MQEIEEIYAGQRGKDFYKRSLFLAGPTPRDYSVKSSWRPEMIALLKKYGFNGYVFIPELEGYVNGYDYQEQIKWEVRHLKRADMIAYWVPREEKIMPGFTTNVEYGEFMGSGKIVLGYPVEAVHMGYLHSRAVMNNVPIFNSMETMAIHIAQRFKEIDLSDLETPDVNVKINLNDLQFEDLELGQRVIETVMKLDLNEALEEITAAIRSMAPSKKLKFLRHINALFLNISLNHSHGLKEVEDKALAARKITKELSDSIK